MAGERLPLESMASSRAILHGTYACRDEPGVEPANRHRIAPRDAAGAHSYLNVHGSQLQAVSSAVLPNVMHWTTRGWHDQ